ncbi:VOC family protein [Acutalibacter caecimuris]|uniref:VOC family protein n=1 Tax=Acutalibacter caecimuris TaxID=3093657 RepID=UPI002AC9CC93|nr:VOC family protein [Acutalibacter sp. M00118]
MARLRCINIVSLAPEKLAAFYGQVLDASANQLVPGRWELPVGETTLVFTATQEKPVIPPDSCGLEFEAPDVDATYARLTGLGIEMEPPVTYPWGWRAIGFRDPDGNYINFVQYVGEAPQA